LISSGFLEPFHYLAGIESARTAIEFIVMRLL
jgi:hypothetical protein